MYNRVYNQNLCGVDRPARRGGGIGRRAWLRTMSRLEVGVRLSPSALSRQEFISNKNYSLLFTKFAGVAQPARASRCQREG